MKIINVSRIITGWIICITFFLAFSITNTENTDDSNMKMYRFGPHDDLYIIGICINTYEKYIIMVLYLIINTCFRNMNHNIIGPWITLNIQDNTEQGKIIKKTIHKLNAFEITNINTIYYWFDWFIYIHLLLAQIDIVLIEVGADLLTTNTITWWYLKQTPEEKDEEKYEQLEIEYEIV